jgi:hypothetical protein
MGILDMFQPNPNVTQDMRDTRADLLMGFGQALSQMDMGQPVDMSTTMRALDARQKSAQMRKVLDTPGLLDKYSPQERALISSMPEELALKFIMEQEFAPAPQPIEVGGVLLDPVTYQPIYDSRQPDTPKPTDDMREYDLAKAQGYQGTFTDYQLDMKRAGATNVSVGPTGTDYGQPPADMAWARNADNTVKLDERGVPIALPITGRPSDIQRVQDIGKMAGEAIGAAEVEANQESGAATGADVILTAARRAREAVSQQNLGPTGTSVVGALPWTDSAEVLRQVATLKSNGTFAGLVALRAASPTGAGVGAASDRDLQLLADKAGALDPNSPTILRDLDDYERTLLRTIYGFEKGDKMFEETRKKSGDVIDGYTIEEVQ